jgi:hypothetical protein
VRAWRPSHPQPNVRDDAYAPLEGPRTREEVPLICPSAQAQIFASRQADWISLIGFSNSRLWRSDRDDARRGSAAGCPELACAFGERKRTRANSRQRLSWNGHRPVSVQKKTAPAVWQTGTVTRRVSFGGERARGHIKPSSLGAVPSLNLRKYVS